ncbi:N-terminal acetyltransferase 2 [Naviculisporaceae sp. PSN 640]
MIRTGLGVLDSLLGNGGAQGRLFNGIIRAGYKTTYPARSARMISTSSASTTLQHWAPTPRFGSSRTALRSTRLKTPLRGPAGPRRPFQSTRARKNGKDEKEHSAKFEQDDGRPLTLSQRLKKLSREYGWTAVGVYLALSVLDFPFCFLLVRIVGTEKIAAVEEIVVRNVQKIIPESVKTFWHNYRTTLKENAAKQSGATAGGAEGEAVLAEDVEAESIGWGVKEAEERKKKEGASLATQLALAYAIHKSFIFIRVPLTAAILPKVVKVLRSWGWKIGRKPVKPGKSGK